MTFVPIDKLEAGMMLDRDVYLYDYKTCKVAMLRSGQVLTQPYIEKLDELEILGAYIHSFEKKEVQKVLQPPIRRELKQEAVSSVQQVFEMFDQTAQNINVSSINQTMAVSKKLVNALKSNKEAKLSIANLKLYDDYTYNHSFGVSVLSIAIGLALELKTNDLYELGFCALLHDIGKMSVPIEIISKPSKLTPEEFEIVKKHPAKGAEFFLRHNLANRRICAGVLSHHEKFDGTGYPNGLSGEDIPLFGRIISIADVYDALTSVRPYRQPSSPPEAIEYIMGSSGNAFDLTIVEAFLKKVSPYPVGSCVKLSNGEIAIIVQQNELHPLRPIIRLFNEPDVILDLYQQRDLQNVVIEDICNISTDQL
jgi:HD-GYP domain-containing protein (c-di-GMP phosphodiesterase class II)